MGSRVVADLITDREISKDEGAYLLSFCNNTSPGFIISFIVMQSLKDDKLIAPFLGLLLGTPVLCSFFFRVFYDLSAHPGTNKKAELSDPYINLGSVIDESISSGMENIVKIGVYMMLFSIYAFIIQSIFGNSFLISSVVLPSLELTNGITILCSSDISPELRYILILFLTSFGGWCCTAQTASMIRGTGLKITPYIIQKLITATATSLICTLYFLLF